MHYQVLQLKDNERPGAVGLISLVETELQPLLPQHSATTFGVFTSLLGLASNEIYLVVSSTEPLSLPQLNGVTRVSETRLTPTIRPTTHAPRQKPGLYVFRWFSVLPGDVGEIVRLSGEAWPSFEADFDAEIQGLFVEEGDSPQQMLLITWYRDLAVWQQ